MIIILHSSACLPPAPQEPENPSGYAGKHYTFDDRGVSLHERPLGAEHPPEADEDNVPEAAAEDGVEHETREDRHAFYARRYRDQRTHTRDEVSDYNGLSAVPLECLARPVQIRLGQEFEPLDSLDDFAQAPLAEQASREIMGQGADHTPR